MEQSESTAAIPVRPSRKATPRRWFQFSLRGFLVVLTIGCSWLGWKVEKARRRGRAIDAILREGAILYYYVGTVSVNGKEYPGRIKFDPQQSIYWFDLTSRPIDIFLTVPLNDNIQRELSSVYDIDTLSLRVKTDDDDVRHLESVDARTIILHDDGTISPDALERLKRHASVLRYSTRSGVLRGEDEKLPR